ncbi:FadR/GntR family transcriptional regulator [Fusibacter ferrireducens]|uniref:FadR family transcriptional regulator n=1 Tax=Fusibacter ferrireducens TaxID=2785058 RepID=A0ABR9ZRP1_9FIRM|nr:FadR/GntR family transcriptional regulator [Fusibacter ferrireducens]MBF4692595.1 FadR family transcriptional regulator [Fusibacter ferrireducens]
MKNMKSKKITHISAVDQVCAHLKEGILSGEWATGTKLPSESDLSAQYGVNRLTVRMALQTLSTLGVVETRAGDGTYVKDFSIEHMFHNVSDFYYERKSVEEIYALRELIEVECCRLAIINATKEDKIELKLRLDLYLEAKEVYREHATEETLNKLVDEDLFFHYQIALMSHNSVYADVFAFTRNFIRQYLSEIILKKNDLWLQKKYDEEPDGHVEIYNSICEKDFEKCKDFYYKTLSIEMF